MRNKVRVLPCGAEGLRQHLAHLGPEHGAAVDEDGGEHERFVLGRVLEPGTGRALPGVDGPHEERVRGADPVGVRVEAAGDEDLRRGPLGEGWRSRAGSTRVDV